MKEKSGRRSFLKNLGIGGVGAAILPTSLDDKSLLAAGEDQQMESGAGQLPYRPFNGKYTGAYLRRVAFPLGGMGGGMFCIEGGGAFSHLSVRHHPQVFNEPGMFAAICVKDRKFGAKVLEGPAQDWKKFGMPDSGNGSGGNIFGLPRFRNVEFEAKFPFSTIHLQDSDLPLKVTIDAWSPFVPGDADGSGLPAAGIEYHFTNTGTTSLEAIFSFNSRNFMQQDEKGNAVRQLTNGFILHQEGSKEKPHWQGDFAIWCDQPTAVIDYCWFRGGWFDPLTITWETIRTGKTKQVAAVESGSPGASLFVPFNLGAGKSTTLKIYTAWYVPESDLHFGNEVKEEDKGTVSAGDCIVTDDLGMATNAKQTSANFKPWYSRNFSGINAVADHWQKNYDDLKKKSATFRDAFFASTLPPEVTEAVAANLTILKSPTVLRQYDGRLWSFEGCGDNDGCCHGSCTHVWNYAQAIPHLFPALERSLRHTEFCESQNAAGHQTFRASLPIRPVDHEFHSAADGQLGGIMKVYREWRISGDDSWLKKMYPLVKVSMDYCIKTWDPRHHGAVEEPHHNTYDIEFWGADAMCTSFYLGALAAFIRMSEYTQNDASTYRELYAKGKTLIENDLYDGEYFFQKIQVKGLDAPNPADPSVKSFGGNYSEEAKKLLEEEGPKYQYGKGCLSDGVLGAWIARMCGLDDVFDARKITSHLAAVHKYNLKDNLSEHANPQRPAYALGDEGGLLLCSWPKGGKLSLPFVYSDEVWTGIEYQVASHLMLMGKVKEGLDVVRTCRKRYDGRVRNPFNEYECGHWYARALSSYGLLQGLTGLRYDAVERSLHVDSKIGDFTGFLAVAEGFGTVTLKQGKVSLKIFSGNIPVEEVILSGKKTKLSNS